MTRICKLLLIIPLLPLVSAAQGNYRPGYIINSKGDTVKGFIDYQVWDLNPKSISFKSTLTDREKKTFSRSDMIFLTLRVLPHIKSLFARSVPTLPTRST